jgi:glycine/D-amino acid oxidase-like deaminating enzyme
MSEIQTNRAYDYLIVGQGIAGTVLAYLLWQQGKSVCILDDNPEFSSSKVAGGLYNPLTGQRITKTWLAEEMFPEVEPFYQGIEQQLHTKFLHPLVIYRPFLSEEAQQKAFTRLQPSDIAQYIKPDTQHSDYSAWVHNPWGGFETLQCGYLDTATFLREMRIFFEKQGMIENTRLDYSQLNISPESIEYKGITSKKLIFCEGHIGLKNPFFSGLPLIPVKGELLRIAAPDLPRHLIFNNGSVFTVPLPDGTFRVGATYAWEFPDENPTPQAREYLEAQLRLLLKMPFEVLEHTAGVRPTVKGRRPLLGVHAKHRNLFIFNGLGAKGVSQAPYWAKHFCDYLDKKTPLHGEVDIRRFAGE